MGWVGDGSQQRAGSAGLNGGGTAAAVPPLEWWSYHCRQRKPPCWQTDRQRNTLRWVCSIVRVNQNSERWVTSRDQEAIETTNRYVLRRATKRQISPSRRHSSQSMMSSIPCTTDVINVFNVFYWVKMFIENAIKKSEKHFWSHRNELIALDFIIKCLGAKQLCTQYTVHITLGGAYDYTAVVMPCGRQSQYVKSWITTNWIKFSLSLLKNDKGDKFFMANHLWTRVKHGSDSSMDWIGSEVMSASLFYRRWKAFV